jgi:hypothetical protein
MFLAQVFFGIPLTVKLDNERGVRNGTASDQDNQKRRTGRKAKLRCLDVVLLMFGVGLKNLGRRGTPVEYEEV